MAVAERDVADSPRFVPEVRRAPCPACSAIVLEVPLPGGLTVYVERAEILPAGECPVCASGRLRDPDRSRWRKRKGASLPSEETYFTRDVPCWRCGAMPGTKGRVGEETFGLGVALSAEGVARLFLPEDEPREGEAVHRAHACPSVRAA